MMGQQDFYSFCLEEVVPDDHQVRAIASVLDLSWVYGELSPHYPALGRPSIDPVLMIRMLILGYAFGLRSERLLCRNELGGDLFEDHNIFRDRIDAALRKAGIKLPAADLKLILKAVS
jgi:hypothetical protein